MKFFISHQYGKKVHIIDRIYSGSKVDGSWLLSGILNLNILLNKMNKHFYHIQIGVKI